MTETTQEEITYLKGYSEGFLAAMKLSWYEAERLLALVEDKDKKLVKQLIEKLRS